MSNSSQDLSSLFPELLTPTTPLGSNQDLSSLFDDVLNPPAPKRRGLIRGVADTGLQVVGSAVSGVQFLTDVGGARNPVSEKLSNISEYVKSLQSAYAKGEDQTIAAIMAQAQDEGVWEQVKAAARAAGVAPVRLALGGIATGVPIIAASLIPGVREAAWGTRLGILGGLGGVQGVGMTKSGIYEAVEQRMLEAGASPEEAAAEAQRQQAYTGPNLGKSTKPLNSACLRLAQARKKQPQRLLGNRAMLGQT